MFVRCLHSDPLQWARCRRYFTFNSVRNLSVITKLHHGAVQFASNHGRCIQLKATEPLSEWIEGIKNVAVEFPLQTAEGNEKYFCYDSTLIVEIFHPLRRNWKIFSAIWKDSPTIFHPPALSPRKFSFPHVFPFTLMRASLKDGEILHSRLVLQINKSIIPLHAGILHGISKRLKAWRGILFGVHDGEQSKVEIN